MKTIAYKFEIGSDDDELSIDQVRQLPKVELDLTRAAKLQPIHDGYDYYANLHESFDIYVDPVDEITYLVETIEAIAERFGTVENSSVWFRFTDKQASRDFMEEIYRVHGVIASMKETHGSFTVYTSK